MKKVFFLIAILFIAAASLYSQTYKIEFTKNEMLEAVTSSSAALANLNIELINKSYELETSGGTVSENYINNVNEIILNCIDVAISLNSIYELANVKDRELIKELKYFSETLQNTKNNYYELEKNHYTNINNMQKKNSKYDFSQIIIKSIEYFLGVPVFSIINQLQNIK